MTTPTYGPPLRLPRVRKPTDRFVLQHVGQGADAPLLVEIDGAVQERGVDFEWSGKALIFATPIEPGEIVTIRFGVAP